MMISKGDDTSDSSLKGMEESVWVYVETETELQGTHSWGWFNRNYLEIVETYTQVSKIIIDDDND